MATCKDCVHYEVCQMHYKQKCELTYETEREVRIAMRKAQKAVDIECDHYKDRSRFVELPCHVGDTVYMLTEQTQKLGRKKITKTVIVECCVDNFRIGDAGYPSAALCDNENVWCYGVEPKMFGEIIFLSRETAEQALKELEGEA